MSATSTATRAAKTTFNHPGHRVPGAVLWNLFDIDAKFGDVETTERCLQYLDEIGGANLKNRKAA